MDTEGLRLFVLAAERLNISAAGRDLGLSPAVASARLSKLEKQLGSDLLHRSTRQVSLSSEGAAFLPHAQEILRQEDAALAAISRGGGELRGSLKMAASSTFAQLHMMPFIGEFADRHPSLTLELRLSDAQQNLIGAGFDLAVRNHAIDDSRFRGRKIADDLRILCASPDYLRRHGHPASPEELARHRLLLFRNATPRKLASRLDEEGEYHFPPISSAQSFGDERGSGGEGGGRVICDDGASMRIACLHGAGIAMSSLWSVHREVQAGRLLRVLPDHHIVDDAAIWLIYPQANVQSAKVRAFIDFLVEKIGSPPRWEQE